MVQHDLTPVEVASGLRPPASKHTTDPQNQSRCVDDEHRETPPTLKHRHEAKIVVDRIHIRPSKSDSQGRPRSRRHLREPSPQTTKSPRPSKTDTKRRSSFTENTPKTTRSGSAGRPRSRETLREPRNSEALDFQLLFSINLRFHRPHHLPDSHGWQVGRGPRAFFSSYVSAPPSHLLFDDPRHVAAGNATPAVRPPKGNQKCMCLPSVCKEMHGGPKKKHDRGSWNCRSNR